MRQRAGMLHWNLNLAVIIILGSVTLSLALIGFTRNIAAVYPTPRPIDFTAYYVASAMLQRGEAAGLYDHDAQERVAQKLRLLGVGGGYLYLPFFAVLLQPLVLLEFENAARVWLGLNLVALFASTHLLLKLAGLDSHLRYTWLAFGLVLIFPPVVSDLIFGQVNILLLLLLTGAVYLLDSVPIPPRREILAGFLIGLASAIKFYPALVLTPLATARRWRAVAGTALAVGVVLVVGLASDRGLENTARYIAAGGPQVSISVEPLNQSIVAALKRSFEPHLYRFPVFDFNNYVEVRAAPLVDAPELVIPVSILLMLAAVVTSFVAVWHMFSRGLPLRLPIALFLCLGLLVVPLVWEYYAVLALIPFAVWLSFREWRQTSLLVIVVVAFLLTVHRYWKVLAVNGVPFWLLAFGLVAIVICWGYTMYLGSKRSLP